VIQEKKPRVNYPPIVQTKNDRNAVNPRPGSLQHIKNITAKKEPGDSLDQYKKKLAYEREHIQIEYEKTMEQREALQELYKQREEEYETIKRFMEFLSDFYVPEMRWFIISTWILQNRFDTISAIMALKHHGKTLSNKERNRLMHALNGNMAMQATCIAVAGAALTYLIRRNQVAVATPVLRSNRINNRSCCTHGCPHSRSDSRRKCGHSSCSKRIRRKYSGSNKPDPNAKRAFPSSTTVAKK
jgi:hypothetical protein